MSNKKKSSKKQGNITPLKLIEVNPLTKNQEKAFVYSGVTPHLILQGSAGTGKTFIALYFALREMLNKNHDRIVIIRSSKQTRDQGHLPGTIDEKMAEFEKPYVSLCTNLLTRGDAYEALKKANKLSFESTSFLRGMTYDDCIIIVDEAQNMTAHELDTVITRIGENTRLFICGDTKQDDLAASIKKEQSGLAKIRDLLQYVSEEFISIVDFTSDDIVRSEFVKQYIIAKEKYGID